MIKLPIEVDRLEDQAYAMKTICLIIGKYVVNDTDKISAILSIAKNLDCIPGRTVYQSITQFEHREFESEDEAVIQRIADIYQ